MMKKVIMMMTCGTLAACSGHLPTTSDKGELQGLHAAIQDARSAGAEKCAPASLAKAEALELHAAHEIDEHGGYNESEASSMVDDGMKAAKKAVAQCKPKHKAKPKPVAKPKPKPKKAAPEVIALDGVFFESNSAKLTPASTATLNKAVEVLKKRADIKVEVAAHTDSGGKASYNEYLSGLRANAVKSYLIAHGIKASRLTAKGYGEAYPIADNSTRAGKAKNRRVELKVQ